MNDPDQIGELIDHGAELQRQIDRLAREVMALLFAVLGLAVIVAVNRART